MSYDQQSNHLNHHPWNKGRLVGQKRPLKPKDVWAIRVRLELGRSRRDLALFDLAIDSKLRACDLVRVKIQDVFAGSRARERATIIQKKTGRPVQFEISRHTRAVLESWMEWGGRKSGIICFPVGSQPSSTYRLANMRDWFTNGCMQQAWTPLHTARIPSDAQR